MTYALTDATEPFGTRPHYLFFIPKTNIFQTLLTYHLPLLKLMVPL